MERATTITATGRLQFAIRFAYMDLDALRPGQLLTLRDDLAIFLGCKSGQGDTLAGKGGIVTTPLLHPMPTEFSEEDFRSLQKEVWTILNGLVHEGMLSMEQIPITASYSFFRSARSNFRILIASGATRDMFLLILFFLLNQEPLDRIMRCPECGTIFYRIRKQQYCSRVCTNRVNVRQWRQAEEHKGQEQERAHRQYVKKHPRAKPQRRPRTGETSHVETSRES